MEKTRVPKGEEYGYVDECGYLTTDYDEGRPLDDIRYEVGNYFNLKDDVDYQEAESVARKLRAVLKGADVIETPSEKIKSTLTKRKVFLINNVGDIEDIQRRLFLLGFKWKNVKYESEKTKVIKPCYDASFYILFHENQEMSYVTKDFQFQHCNYEIIMESDLRKLIKI